MKKKLTFVTVLVLFAGTAIALTWLKSHQRLGQPGIIAEAIPDNSPLMKFDLPAQVLEFDSTNLPTSEVVLGFLPKDTSYASRWYQSPDGLGVQANIILQGADRSSIHKPDYCWAGMGYNVVSKSVENLTIGGPQPYEMPVAKWIGSRMEKLSNGQTVESRCVYVFWFVADREQTVSYDQHRNWIMRDLLRSGVLQRWAYVSYAVAGFLPGQEDAVFERMRKLVAASVPRFQYPPQSGAPAAGR